MPKRTTPYRDRLLERLSVPEEAANYLNAAMDDSPEIFLEALRDVAQARQIANVARTSGLTREAIYRSFSSEGNPTLSTLTSVLCALNLKIAIAPEKKPAISAVAVRSRKDQQRRSAKKRSS